MHHLYFICRRKFYARTHVNITRHWKSTLRACFHGGGGPQVGSSEVTRLGGVTRLVIYSHIWSPHLSCKRDLIKMRDYVGRRVTPPKRVSSPGVPHLHVNRLLNGQHALQGQELNGKNAVQVTAVLLGVKSLLYHRHRWLTKRAIDRFYACRVESISSVKLGKLITVIL